MVRASSWWPAGALVASFVLLVIVCVCYAFRPDAGAAVTVFPPWVWPLPGLMLAGIAWRIARGVAAGVVATLWLLFVLGFAEEPRALTSTRSWPSADWDAARRQGSALRIISLNCAGSKEAAAEVTRYNPEIVLLQESPPRAEVSVLAARLFGSEANAAPGFDVSVLARGHVRPAQAAFSRFNIHVTQTSVRLPSGLMVEVFSVRLKAPLVRLDLWSPAAWLAYREDRRARREQLRYIAGRVEGLGRSTPVILGGDFNAPAGDAVFDVLRPRLHDAYREGGLGLGNTALNDFPMHRIDQIWTSDHFRAAAVVVRQTMNSDHRMLIADLIVRSP